LRPNTEGIAWNEDGFYNATDGKVHMPEITVPIDDATAYNMRRVRCAFSDRIFHS
jgi:hypothetical protein